MEIFMLEILEIGILNYSKLLGQGSVMSKLSMIQECCEYFQQPSSFKVIELLSKHFMTKKFNTLNSAL
jgi:hypothetical protein